VMRPIGVISTRTCLLGRFDVDMPVFISPAGVHALCDPVNGESASAQAAAKAGILFGLSQHSTRSIEDVAQIIHPRSLQFYQAYILKDRARTMSLILRAVRAGYQGIILTVDSVRFGYREADARNGFNALPPPHRLVNYHSDYLLSNSSDSRCTESTTTSLDQTYNSQEKNAWDQNIEQLFAIDVTWKDVTWIKNELNSIAAMSPTSGGTPLPLVVKGIMTAEDAILAVEAGADAVMVSNHGGRQLDGCLAPIDVLPEIVAAVRGRVPIWLDSGVRRGTDVLKALSLGAAAVGIGKPVFFALSLGGEEAVSYMLQLLKNELETAMAICGVQRISEITSDLVTRHPALSQSSTNRADFRTTIPFMKSSL
jgi:isopentenyl diphosphate isomerase/L-lactate dehydrogenase-like FMN-dependent dehydrogenase